LKWFKNILLIEMEYRLYRDGITYVRDEMLDTNLCDLEADLCFDINSERQLFMVKSG